MLTNTDTIQHVFYCTRSIIYYANVIDNGGFVNIGGDNYPLRGQKNTVWEGGVRGAAFINSPLLNLNGHGRVSRDLMHISDWFPTFVGLAGGDVSGIQLDGHDLWPTLR